MKRNLIKHTCSRRDNLLHYKYFVVYLYNDNEVKPLHKMLPQTSAHVKSYDRQTKWMSFLIEDGDSLKKYYLG